MLLLEPDGWMLSLGRHLLIQHVLDGVGAVSAVLRGTLKRCQEGRGAIVIFEIEESFDTLL
jgi:hypothetical protein